jgi:hypothetical protein
METLLRAGLIEWLRADPFLMSELNSVTEEAPVAVAPPWLGLVASASIDWSTKTRKGREVRVALELHVRGDDPATAGAVVRAIEERIESFPPTQRGFEVASVTFLRARAEQRSGNRRAMLLEYRFRILTPEMPEEGIAQ